MKIESFDGPAAFLARATSFLVMAEAVHCILLGAPGDAVRFGSEQSAQFWCVVNDDGEVSGAALVAPPLSLAISRMAPRAVLGLAEHLHAADISLPGVRGPIEAASAFGEAWTRLGHGQMEPTEHGEHAWELRSVEPTGPCAGRLVLAREDELAAVQPWAQEAAAAFDEAPEDWNRSVALAVRQEQLYAWCNPEPVAMAMFRGQTPSGVRVSGVFTPSAQQRRGYATALVAAMSEAALNAGRGRCFLFTDATNATAEGIYARIGYRQVAVCQHYRFVAPAEAREGSG